MDIESTTALSRMTEEVDWWGGDRRVLVSFADGTTMLSAVNAPIVRCDQTENDVTLLAYIDEKCESIFDSTLVDVQVYDGSWWRGIAMLTYRNALRGVHECKLRLSRQNESGNS